MGGPRNSLKRSQLCAQHISPNCFQRGRRQGFYLPSNDKGDSPHRSAAWWFWTVVSSSFVLTVVASGLYVPGKVYYSAYLERYGIAPDLFPLSFYDILFYGFAADLNTAAEMLKPLTEIGFMLGVVFMVIAILVGFTPSEPGQMAIRFLRFKNWVSKWLFFGKIINKDGLKYLIAAYVSFVIPQLFALLLLVILVLISGAKKGGVEWANNEMLKITGKVTKGSEEVLLKFENVELLSQTGKIEHFEGYRIAASDKFYAIYQNEIVKVFPMKDIKSITVRRKPA